ncbi:MaoC/PaaZ C-terminal domain-containing protein [Pseudonocardia pini]|uniref:MaoC/PaaZ C-terminal domain-containing protein n=1 Tax=Pseudonocardia pini TaxID=2758030 RepID=UPI0015F0A3C6|nr:MaoC/PaaZ C-terminal domain-containing protein [Pseudonocardia pini]
MSAPSTAVEVGTEAPAREFGPLTRQMFVRYSGASGDLNPMHYDDEMARSAGYPSVFSQGMHVAALLAGYATDWLGAERVRRFGVRFRDQVYPGDVLSCSGVVTDTAPRPDGVLVTVALAAKVDERTALTATADFLLPG